LDNVYIFLHLIMFTFLYLKKIQTVRKGSIKISFPYEAVKQNTETVGKEFYKFLHCPNSLGSGMCVWL